MPIIEDTPLTPPVEKPVPVQVTAPEFRGVTVNSRYEAVTSLLTHIEGASWTVNYYSQVLGLDNALSGQNLDRPAAYQQYKLIQDFEFKVTTSLNTTQDQNTKEFNVTGQAHVYPCGLVPNEGDCFIADVGDGREAVFEITGSEKRSIYRDGAYIVDYKIVAWSEQDNRIQDLNSKVVQTLHLTTGMMDNGQRGLMDISDYQLSVKLQVYHDEIVDYYFSRFMSRDLRTLILPGQDNLVYDPFLTRAVLAMLRDEQHPNIKLIRELNVHEDQNYNVSNIWTALLKKRRKELIGSMQKVGLVNCRAFSRDPVLNSVRYAGVDFVVYPIPTFTPLDYEHGNQTKLLSSVVIKPTHTQLVDLFDLIQIDDLNGLPSFEAPAINRSNADTYVFSPQFYQRTSPGQSALELAFQNYLDDKAIPLKLLLQLCVSYTSWAPLDQFYQIPFLLAMVRGALRRM
jgi:hypothetical protein